MTPSTPSFTDALAAFETDQTTLANASGALDTASAKLAADQAKITDDQASVSAASADQQAAGAKLYQDAQDLKAAIDASVAAYAPQTSAG